VDITQSNRSKELGARVQDFMAEHIYPNERRYYQEAERLGPWAIHPIVEELKPIARQAHLWNLFRLAKSIVGFRGSLDNR
jgi:acyl-CoA dehydrogenase